MNDKPLEFTGTIESISPVQQVSEKFRKQEFVMSDKSSQYPQMIQFELQQDKCDLMKNYVKGSLVTVSFNLKGRNWTNPQGEVKTFNTLSVWRMVKMQVDGLASSENASGPTTSAADDLPF